MATAARRAGVRRPRASCPTAPCTATNCASGWPPSSVPSVRCPTDRSIPAFVGCRPSSLIDEVDVTPAIESAAPPLSARRARVVYAITADGKEEFSAWANQPGPEAWEDEGFAAHLAFFGRTESRTRLRILEGRRSRLEERVDTLRESLARGRERVDAYTLQLQQHGLDGAEREVRWLNELIQNEQSTNQSVPSRYRRSSKWVRFASQSSESATAPRRSSRASSTTRMPIRPASCPDSCTSSSVRTTSATSSSSPPSTSTARRSDSTSPRPSTRPRTTP